MPRNGRIVERLWGRRLMGGWIIQNSQLIDALKKGQAVEFDKIVVGADQLRRLINLLPYDDCLIRANGRLEVETVERVMRSQKNGSRKAGYRKPKHYRQFMAIENKAWLPNRYDRVVVLKPRKF